MGLYSDLGAPFFPVTLATDAEGDNSHDFGGFGVVGALLGPQTQEAMWEGGLRPGKALVRQPGAIEKVVKRGETKTLKPFVPITSVPEEALSPDIEWTELLTGRWRYADNIALGEARAAIAPLEKLAWARSAHRTKMMSLEDNMVTAWAFAKGRSSANDLNYLCRRRAALMSVTDIRQHLPWTDTERQPADKLSRSKPGRTMWQDAGAPPTATNLGPRRGVQS